MQKGGEMVILGRSFLNEPPVPRDKTSIIDVKRAQDHYQTLRYTGDMISLKVIFSMVYTGVARFSRICVTSTLAHLLRSCLDAACIIACYRWLTFCNIIEKIF